MIYADLAFLRSYHDARGNTAWSDATDDERAVAVADANAWLDKRYGVDFGVVAGEVPTEVAFAAADAALSALAGEIDADAIDAVLKPIGIVSLPKPRKSAVYVRKTQES